MSNYFRTFGTYDKISVLDQIKAHWSQNKEQGDFVFYLSNNPILPQLCAFQTQCCEYVSNP